MLDETFNPTTTSVEIDGIDALLEQIRENLHPGNSVHYADDDIAAMKSEADNLNHRRKFLEAAAHTDPTIRFDALRQQWFDVDARTIRAAAEAAIAMFTEYLPASVVYVRLAPSFRYDERGVCVDEYFDATGTPVPFADEDDALDDVLDYLMWLPHSGRGWEEFQLADTAHPEVTGVVSSDRPTLKLR